MAFFIECAMTSPVKYQGTHYPMLQTAPAHVWQYFHCSRDASVNSPPKKRTRKLSFTSVLVIAAKDVPAHFSKTKFAGYL